MVSAYGYGKRSWFFGDFGVIEYRFDDETGSRWIFAEVSEDNNVLIMFDEDDEQDLLVDYRLGNDPQTYQRWVNILINYEEDDEEDFLDAIDEATSSELHLSLYDDRFDRPFDFEISGKLSVAGYREHVKPTVEACD